MARTDDSLSPASAPATKTIFRDDKYYFEDGDCIIRAGSSLFKIDRSYLKRNSLFFQNLFSLPQATSEGTVTVPKEGTSDDNPIICQDSAKAFRDLCWILYAGPHDLYMQSRLTVLNARRVANIALLAHKYEFHALGQWVLDMLQQKRSSQIFQTCSFMELEDFILAAEKFGWDSIKGTLTNELIERIRRGGTDPLPSFTRSLRFAEKLQDCDLQLQAYYTYLKTTGWKLNHDVFKESVSGVQGNRTDGPIQVLNSAGLSGPQIFRLCAGFTSLLSIRSRLRTLPSIKDCKDCKPGTGAHQTCLKFWTTWWTTEEAKLRVDDTNDNQDPITFLQAMQRRLAGMGIGNRSRSGWEPTSICANNIVAQIKEMENTLMTDLCKYFMLSNDIRDVQIQFCR